MAMMLRSPLFRSMTCRQVTPAPSGFRTCWEGVARPARRRPPLPAVQLSFPRWG